MILKRWMNPYSYRRNNPTSQQTGLWLKYLYIFLFWLPCCLNSGTNLMFTKWKNKFKPQIQKINKKISSKTIVEDLMYEKILISLIHLNYQLLQMKNQNLACAVYYNKTNLLHKSSKPHPESPERLNALIQSLKKLNEKTKESFEMKQVLINEGKITAQQTQKIMIQVHGSSYWEFVKEMWHEGIKKSEMYINIDTYFMKDTYIAALQAARTAIIAADSLANSDTQNCFALVRPPGHHSGLKSQPHGFSFFNNVALAANYLISSRKANKIAIVDWDVHHGEGTQKLFYQRKDILFISMHRYDNGKFFPHIQQSSSKNIGSGPGVGYNINICWNLQQKPKGSKYQRQETCGDEQYLYAFDKIVMPVLNQFSPDYILVSCGFDSACGDPIGNLKITEAGYSMMTQKLKTFKKKILLVLEGGYSNQVLSWAGEAIVRSLTGTETQQTKDKINKIQAGEPNKIGIKGVEESKTEIQKYWNKI